MKKHLNVTNYKKNSVNPFFEDTVQHMEIGDKYIYIKGEKPDMIVKDSGELVSANPSYQMVKKVDRATFTKIFNSEMIGMFELKKTALAVLVHIMKSLKPNADFFFYDLEDFKEGTGYKSSRSILDGISELLEKKFIARSNSSYKYFINPVKFFNGDRITFAKTYVVDEGKKFATVENTKQPTLK